MRLFVSLLTLLWLASSAWAVPVFVQSKSNTGAQTIAFTADMTVGNTVIGAFATTCVVGCGLSTVTDSCSNSYLAAPAYQITPTLSFVAVFFGRITTGGACTITVSPSGTGISGEILAIHEYSDMSSTPFEAALVDRYKTNSDGTGTTATDGVTSTAAVETTQDNDLVFAVAYLYDTDTTINAGTGFTQREAQTKFLTEDRVLSPAAAPVGTFTTPSAAKPYVVIMVSILDPSLVLQNGTFFLSGSALRMK